MQMQIKIEDKISNNYAPSLDKLNMFFKSRGFKSNFSEKSIISNHLDYIINTGYSTNFLIPREADYPVVKFEEVLEKITKTKPEIKEYTLICWLLINQCEPIIYDIEWVNSIYIPTKGHQIIKDELSKFEFNDINLIKILQERIYSTVTIYDHHFREIEVRKKDLSITSSGFLDEYRTSDECISRLYWLNKFKQVLWDEYERLNEILEQFSTPISKYSWKESSPIRPNPKLYNDDLDMDQQSPEWWDDQN
jgi:hypothetical protein